MESIVNVLRSRYKFIVIFAISAAVLAGLLSFTRPLCYSASVRLLITQQSSFTLDPYTALRSTELVGENLVQIVSTSSFLARLLETGYQIDDKYFALIEQKRRNLWEDTIKARMISGTGLFTVTAFHPSKQEAIKIVSATAFLLSTQGSEYVGRNITVRLVDPPLASRFPAKPNFALNILTGGALGLLAGSGIAWVDHRKKKHGGHLM